MRPVLIIKAGFTFDNTRRLYGDFEDWTARFMGLAVGEYVIFDAVNSSELPLGDAFSAVVITGSHSMVSDREPWSERLGRWTRGLVEKQVPLLGICYGHQLLAYAMGGVVDYHPKGIEIGTVNVRLSCRARCDSLFSTMPATFTAHVTHRQSVLKLPESAVLLAGNFFEPHHAFRVGPCAWGVQFHPEYDAKVMHSYIDEQGNTLRHEGFDTELLHEQVVETPQANAFLRTFTQLVTSQTAQSAA